MPHILTAKEQSLGQIFGGDYVLTIPCYQRPYAWDKEQVQELLDDLLYVLAPALIFLVRYCNQPESTVRFFGRLERLANSMLESKYGLNERVKRFSVLTTAIENDLESDAADHAIHSAHLKE